MAKILFVHGMRMDHHHADRGMKLREDWHRAVKACLEKTAWGQANPTLIPTIEEVGLVYWGDFFRPEGQPAPVEAAKGIALDTIKAGYYAFLRGVVRVADQASFFDKQGRPRGPVAPFVDEMVYQSAVYMHNGPVFHPAAGVADGAYFQVQHRFTTELNKEPDRSPCVVIGHSLGTVVAYEGLCRNAHGVHTFITIGSPLGTPHLIVEYLKKRVSNRVSNKDQAAASGLPWPGVRRWVNFFAGADVWCVPVPRLRPLITGGDLTDVEVQHGTPHDPVITHRLQTYLAQHVEIGDEIARALAACSTDQAHAPGTTA
jgi:hypothetical protein